MNEKTIVSEETIENKPAKTKKQKDRKELHDVFYAIAIILAVAAMVFVLIAKNAVNGEGFFSIQPFNIKKPIEVEFLTTFLSSVIGAGLSVLSVGFGLLRNLLKHQKLLMSYLPGVITLVLSVIAYLAYSYAA